ncbi:MAG: tetratricopeptide repeat protein [Deltaproteobacteria bacterium]|nr:tetratricopeptide repeat protein [Deltaproteobacteria bacterium]
MRAAALIAPLIAVLAVTAVADATPTQDLDRGRQSFRARDWASAIPVLNALLYPELQLARKEDAIEAHVLLGAAHFESGDTERARDEFEKALQIDPDRTITTLMFSSAAVRLFDQVREEQRGRIERDADRKRLAEAAEKLELYRKSLVVYEARPYYLNFMPFGLAQYTQNRTRVGALFTLSQGITFATSVGIYGYLVGTYGFENSDVPILEGPRVRQLQQLTIASGIAFYALYAFGVFDAIRHHKPRQQVQGDDSLIPKDLLEPTKKPAPNKTSFRDRIQVSPMVTPESVGIGIGWEN